MQRTIITDDLSSLAQQSFYMQGIEREDLAGLLRLEILLYGKLVVPDSHLFDGCLMLDLGSPEDFAELCGHSIESPTVEVRLRAKDFRTSLSIFLRDGQTGLLRAQEFRYLRDQSLERRVADGIALGIPSPAGADPADVTARAMLDLGANPDRVESLAEAHAAWEAHGPRLRLFGSWPNRPFRLEDQITRTRLQRSSFQTEQAFCAYEEVRELVVVKGNTRSASADAVIRGSLTAGAEIVGLEDDLAIVRDWYHDCRQMAIADQHNSVLTTRVSSVARLAEVTISEELAIADADAKVHITDIQKLVFGLGSIGAKEFRELLALTAAARREWLTSRSRQSLENLLLVAIRKLEAGGPQPTKPWYLQERIILPGATALTGYVAAGPWLGAIAGAITVGITESGAKLRDVLSRRRATRALVRWVTTAHTPSGSAQ